MIEEKDLDFLIKNKCISESQALDIAALLGMAYKTPQEKVWESRLKQQEAQQNKVINAVPDAPLTDGKEKKEQTPSKLDPYIEFAKRNYLAIFLSALGAILTLGGLSTLTVVHWYTMPLWIKMLGGIMLMLIVWVSGFYLHEINRQFPKTSYALCMLGAAMWGVNLKLYSFLYHVSSTPAQSVLTFLIGIFPLPFIIKLKGLWLMVIGSAFLWSILCSLEPSATHWASPLLFSSMALVVWSLGELFNKIFNGYYSSFSVLSIIIGKLSFFITLPVFLSIQHWTASFDFSSSSGIFAYTPTSYIIALISCVLLALCGYANRNQLLSGNLLNCLFIPVSTAICLLIALWQPDSISLSSSIGLMGMGYLLLAFKQKNLLNILCSSLMLFIWAVSSNVILVWEHPNMWPLFALVIIPICLGIIYLSRTSRGLGSAHRNKETLLQSVFVVIASLFIFPNTFNLSSVSLPHLLIAWSLPLYVSLGARQIRTIISTAAMTAVVVSCLVLPGTIYHYTAILALICVWALLKESKIAFLGIILLSVLSIGLMEFIILPIGIMLMFMALTAQIAGTSNNTPAKHYFTHLLRGYTLSIFLLCLLVGYFYDNANNFSSHELLFILFPLTIWSFAEVRKGIKQPYCLQEWIHRATFFALIPICLFVSAQFASLALIMFMIIHLVTLSVLPRQLPSLFILKRTCLLLCVAFAFILFLIAADFAIPNNFSEGEAFWLFAIPVASPLILTGVLASRKAIYKVMGSRGYFALLLLPIAGIYAASMYSLITPWEELGTFGILLLFLPWTGPAFLTLSQQSSNDFRLVLYSLILFAASIFFSKWILLSASIIYCYAYLGLFKKNKVFYSRFLGLTLAGIIACCFASEESIPFFALLFLPWLTGIADNRNFLNNKSTNQFSPWLPLLAALFSFYFCFGRNASPAISSYSPEGIFLWAAVLYYFLQNTKLCLFKTDKALFAFKLTNSILVSTIILFSIWMPGWPLWTSLLTYAMFRLCLSPTNCNLITSGTIFAGLFYFCGQQITHPLASSGYGLFYYLLLAFNLFAMLALQSHKESLFFYFSSLSGSVTLAFSIILTNSTLFQEAQYLWESIDYSILFLLIPALFILKNLRHNGTRSLWLLSSYIPLLLFASGYHAVMYIGMGLFITGIVIAGIKCYKIHNLSPLLPKLLLVSGSIALFALPFPEIPQVITSPNVNILFIPLYFVMLSLACSFIREVLGKTIGKGRKTSMILLIFWLQLYCYFSTDPNDYTKELPPICLLFLPGLIITYCLLFSKKQQHNIQTILYALALLIIPACCNITNLYITMILLVLLGSIFVSAGLKRTSSIEVNSGVILIALVALSLSFNLIDSIQEKGLAFLISGIILLALSFITEKTRRHLIRQLKETEHSQP